MRRTLVALAIALCALGCQPSASFQPEGACVADGRAAGTYPELEARLPPRLGEAAPTTVDSGRSCSDAKLSTLRTRGVADLRFAGATWDLPREQSVVVAVFATPPGQPPLEAGWMSEFYEAGARQSTKTENIDISHPSYEGPGEVYQLDTLNDLSFQSVIVWPGSGVVHAVIVATQLQPGGLSRADHDAEVKLAVEAAWGAG